MENTKIRSLLNDATNQLSYLGIGGTSPFGSAVLAIGANASFVARTIDMELDMTKDRI